MKRNDTTLHPIYRLAFDLGSTSLGWTIFRLNSQLEPIAIIKAGVRIFNDGRNPKDGTSLAVTRRLMRGMRRRRDRLLKRKARMLNCLMQYGFFPMDAAARKALEKLNPYELRARGLVEALQPGEFARALFHINQRRGFKSNRKTDKKDNDSGALKTAINQLRQALKDEDCQTVGAWLWQRMQNGQGVRACYRETRTATAKGKNKIDKSYDLYIERAMIEQEFDALWAKQVECNPALFHEQARLALKDTLLHQRPLRPVEPGRCTLLPDEGRAPLALPSQQRFRIYQEVNNLRLLDSGLHETPLTLTQRDRIVTELEKENKITFASIRKLLALSGSTKFNLENVKRKELKGNATSVILSKPEYFGKAWSEFSETQQDMIVWQLVNEENESQLIDWLKNNVGIDEARAEKIANVSLLEGYGSLSRKALARILPELRREVITYNKAVKAAGFEHHSQFGFEYEPDDVEYWVDTETGEITRKVFLSKKQMQDWENAQTDKIKPVFKQLTYYGKALQRHVGFGSGKPEDSEEKRYGKIANPTVHIGLNQVQKVVNTLIHRYGRPAEVIIELARDLKRNHKQKLEAQERQADNQKRNQRIRKAIAGVLKISEARVSRNDIQKWILWEELNPKDVADLRCPYSGVQISASMLLSEEVEIEHILPFSQTWDDSMNNKTVAMRRANRIKGNRTPWQARADFEAQGWMYESILQRAAQMTNGKKWRFGEDAVKDKDFLARALNDTRYLSRVAAEYLKLVCPQGTRVIPGSMTALLRKKFGLNSVLGLDGEKNRNDHRHHAVDACVIGVTDQGLMQKFATANASAREQQLNRLVGNMPLPWKTYYEHVERAIRHIWVSHKPDHGYEGAIMEETSYGLARDGNIRQKRKTDGSEGREVSSLIRIAEPAQPKRHGIDAEGKPLPYKGYVGGSNYCIEITKNDKGKWEGEVISTFRAYKIVHTEGEARLRHPHLAQNGNPLVMRLIIDDSIRLEIDDREQTMRVVKIGQNGQVFMVPLNEANVDARNRDKKDSFAYISKTAGTFQKAKARRVTISPIGELRDPGFHE
jgi:CRISPR-associated endonuclease Csn1